MQSQRLQTEAVLSAVTDGSSTKEKGTAYTGKYGDWNITAIGTTFQRYEQGCSFCNCNERAVRAQKDPWADCKIYSGLL